jgi:glycosyltransferase involved in cell wall biosynthesis
MCYPKMSNSVAILFFIESISFGGYEKRYVRMAHLLSKYKYDTYLAINQNSLNVAYQHDDIRALVEDFRSNGKLIIISIFNRSIIGRMFLKLSRMIFGIDVRIYFALKKLNNVNTIVYTNTYLRYIRNTKKIIDCTIFKELVSPEKVDDFIKNKDYEYISCIDKLILISKALKDRLDTYKYLIGNKYSRVYYYKQPFIYNDNNIMNYSIINEKKNIMIYAHRFIERKNPILFARIVKELCNNEVYNSWNFKILGSGPLQQEIEKLLDKEITNERVVVKYAKDLRAELIKSKIFCSFIEPDSFPSQSVVEAMQCGNAIVVLNSGYSREFIDGNGAVVEKDLDDAISKISKMMTNNIKDMCLKSMNIVSKNYDSANYLRYFEELLSQ